MTFITVQCPHCHSEQIVKRGKTGCGTQRYSATCARTWGVPKAVFCSTTVTMGVCPRSSKGGCFRGVGLLFSPGV